MNARLTRIPGSVRGVVALLCAFLLAAGEVPALAQDKAAAPAAASGAEADAPKLKPEQLDALLAPIALYPDPLLSQVLVASTYPLEIIQAQQWLAKNKDLKGDALVQASQKQKWDPSIQSMTVFPDVIKRMSENVTWTTDLGNAFLAQGEDVMSSVQRLRAKAKAAGKLASSEQQKVTTKVVEKETIIEIQPVSTQVVYVPVYSPTVIWGPPPYAYYPYPPIYYPPPPPPGGLFIAFGVGMAIGASMHGGWGYGCGWGHYGGGNTIIINNNNNYIHNSNVKNNVNVNNKTSNWQHNSSHRGGAPYPNKSTSSKYSGNSAGGNAANRSASANSNRGASPTTQNRGSGGTPSASNRAASGGGDQVGNRDVPKSSPAAGKSAFGGGSDGGSGASARASSARGSSSMGSRGGGGGGGRRR